MSNWSGLAHECLHAAAYDVAGGLVPTDEDEKRLVHERVVIEPLSVDLSLHQGSQEVVGGSGATTLGDEAGHERVPLAIGGGCLFDGVGIIRTL